MSQTVTYHHNDDNRITHEITVIGEDEITKERKEELREIFNVDQILSDKFQE